MNIFKQYPVSTYFVLTFAISWGGFILALGGPAGFANTDVWQDASFGFAVAAMLAGPSVAGLLMTSLIDGKAGLGRLFSILIKWRVGIRWYAISILTAPILSMIALFSLSISSPIFTVDNKFSILLPGIIAGLSTVFEEIGWTGFAINKLRQRYSILATGLIVGSLWGAWHFLASLWGSSGSSGGISLALYLPVMLFSFLPPYRVLMVLVYDRTGSLLVAMLMHLSLTASVRILDPLAISGAPILIYNLVLAAALWIVVAIVAIAKRGNYGQDCQSVRCFN